MSYTIALHLTENIKVVSPGPLPPAADFATVFRIFFANVGYNNQVSAPVQTISVALDSQGRGTVNADFQQTAAYASPTVFPNNGELLFFGLHVYANPAASSNVHYEDDELTSRSVGATGNVLVEFTYTAVPEPMSLALLAGGAVSAVVARRRSSGA